MSKAIFTTKIGSAYDDLPETRYHFPRKYFNQVQKAVGDYIIYYEPRRSSIETSGSRGRQSYFAIARITAIVEDTNIPDHFYALMDSYLDFDQPVRFSENDFYYESALKKIDGTTNRGFFGWAVRPIPENEFDLILRAGFAPIVGETFSQHATFTGFAEPDIVYERPMVELTATRPFREKSFMHNVRNAYSNRCAVTGLKLINGGGRPEVQAAHIQPVAANGPDATRNGLALSGTARWMFDRGLISIGDAYQILVAEKHVPEDARRLLNHSGQINLPDDTNSSPQPALLEIPPRDDLQGLAGH